MTEILASNLGPWTVRELLIAFGLLLGATVIRAILVQVVVKRLRTLAERTETAADDLLVAALVSPLGHVLPVIGAYAAFRVLAAGYVDWLEIGDKIFKAGLTLVITWTAMKVIDAVAVWFQEKALHTSSRLDDQIIPLLRKSAKVFLGVLAFILVAQNLGYSVSGLLAGLGIGGIALAMAARDTLANFFGSIMILADRPFHVGDWITTSTADGTVEEIGLRSTRVRTFAKTLVSIPNSEVANTTIENHSLMPKRRIKFDLGVTYASTADQMRQAVQRIEDYLHGSPDIHQEFMLVKFTEFGASSLNIFVYCFTVTTNWTEHLNVRQQVNLAIMDILESLGMQVAFPTRTVHLVQEDEQPEPLPQP